MSPSGRPENLLTLRALCSSFAFLAAMESNPYESEYSHGKSTNQSAFYVFELKISLVIEEVETLFGSLAEVPHLFCPECLGQV